MNSRYTLPLILVAGLLLVLSSSLFVVHQTQQALVLQFGEPKNIIKTPGLKVKMPFIQDVVFYDNRLLDLDPPNEKVILGDQKRLVVDTYSRYHISDPLKFYQAVGNEYIAHQRLSRIINSRLRSVLGNKTLEQVLSFDREAIMASIQRGVNEEAQKFGIDIIDVRIRRADLPPETSVAIYNRMISERIQEAKEFRAQGDQLYQEITADADKQRIILLAEAERKAQITRGEGDAQAYKTYATAFGKDPEFFAFYRSMQAYRKSLTDKDTTFVLSPDSDFFDYFNNARGRRKK